MLRQKTVYKAAEETRPDLPEMTTHTDISWEAFSESEQ